MDQFFQFVINHWELWLLLLVIIVLLVVNEYINKALGVPQLSSNEVINLMNRQNAVVVDIRDHTAFSSGHIANAINIPRTEIMQALEKLHKFKTKPLVLTCAQGQQVVSIAKKLKRAGVENLNILKGGMAAWSSADLPVKKGVK
jgi:rhodanese-related sulfurtransferase